jgi:hypothetical protein
MGMGGGGNQYLLFYLGDKALLAADRTQTYYALQRRHPDGDRWLDVGHFGTRDIAKLALDAFVTHGQGETDDFRVKKITISRAPA